MSIEERIQWKLLSRRHKREKKHLAMTPATSHPLHSIGNVLLPKENFDARSSKNAVATKKPAFVDPLSSVLEGSDPLSSFSSNADPLSSSVAGAKLKSENFSSKGSKNNDAVSPIDLISFASWETQLAELAKFTTKQHLTLASSFLSSTETDIRSRNLPNYRRVVKVQNNIPDRVKGTSQTSVERVKARLEHLDSMDDGVGGGSGGGLREMGGLTQEQFTQHLITLKDEMKLAWKEEQRVKALKIAIQCVKALSLSPPEIFYPCKFTIISGLLDTLGSLVYKRLVQITESSHSSAHFSPKYEAEETARNWFFKVTSIRELLPRIYLEAALLPCYTILPPEEGRGALKRLILMCQGVGDPLVGAYVRMYIVHVGLKHEPEERGHVQSALEGVLVACNWGWNGNGIEDIEVQKEELERGSVVAQKIFVPPLKWLLQCLPKTPENLKSNLDLLGASSGLPQYVLLKGLLQTFPPTLLALHCADLLRILDSCFAHGDDPQDLLVALGMAALERPPPSDQCLDVLNAAWLLLVRLRPVHNYLKAATAWLKFAGANFPSSVMDKVLGDVLKRLSKFTSTSQQTFYLPLLHLLITALSCNSCSEDLYAFPSFHGLLSIFQRESSGGVGLNNVTEMKQLLEAALLHHKDDFTDPAVVQLLLSLFATLHDAINAMTTQDEIRQISQLVNTFLRQVDYGKDFELQLEFYVDARAAFSNLDSVLESLIQHVLRLQVSTLRRVKGQHSGKTAAFERACTAYSFITIPSLSCPLSKLKLYLLCGAVAMVNNCMGQGDACVKSAVKVILDLGNSSPPDGIPSALASVTSFLVAAPDPPDAPRPLYLFRGLLNSLKALAEAVEPLCFFRLNLMVLKGVCVSAQDTAPYHFSNVDGNDTLYGGSDILRVEAESICTEILRNITALLKEIVNASDVQQVSVLRSLLDTILSYADISDPDFRAFAFSLFSLVHRHKLRSKTKTEIQTLFEDSVRDLSNNAFRNAQIA